MKIHLAIGVAAAAVFSLSCAHKAMDSGDGWITLFDGKTMAGWTVSEDCGHGDTKAWSVVDGAIIGQQDRVGNGGIIYSDAVFSDFEIELEINPDYELDSGLFLRSTTSGKCYQVTIDNYEKSGIGGVYGEGIGGFHVRNENWQDMYRQGEWNVIRATIEGNPPIIDVWVNGQPSAHYEGDEKLLGDAGHICLQVHAGDGYMGKKARFRNIRVRPLK